MRRNAASARASRYAFVMAMKPENLFIRACSTGKPDVVRELVGAGQPPDTRDKYGLTGLIWAGRKGQIEVAKVLLAAGADLEGKDRRGRTAIFHAIAYKRHAFVEYLISQSVPVLSESRLKRPRPSILRNGIPSVREEPPEAPISQLRWNEFTFSST